MTKEEAIHYLNSTGWLEERERIAIGFLDSIGCFEEHDRIMTPSTDRPRGRWIPVSERLPTKEEYIANNGLFIVSDGNRNYAEYFDIYDSKKFGELIVFGFRVDKCVIAWMPLPVEPYKAESEE